MLDDAGIDITRLKFLYKKRLQKKYKYTERSLDDIKQVEHYLGEGFHCSCFKQRVAHAFNFDEDLVLDVLRPFKLRPDAHKIIRNEVWCVEVVRSNDLTETNIKEYANLAFDFDSLDIDIVLRLFIIKQNVGYYEVSLKDQYYRLLNTK